jgi:hypothetical protein
MSVKAFLTDDTYERGNYHYAGRPAGRYAAESKQTDLGEQLVDAVPRIMPSLVANYMLLRTVDKLVDKFSDLVPIGGEPQFGFGDLAKSSLSIAAPGAILSGFLNSVKPTSVLSAALRASRK